MALGASEKSVHEQEKGSQASCTQTQLPECDPRNPGKQKGELTPQLTSASLPMHTQTHTYHFLSHTALQVDNNKIIKF